MRLKTDKSPDASTVGVSGSSQRYKNVHGVTPDKASGAMFLPRSMLLAGCYVPTGEHWANPFCFEPPIFYMKFV
jgi:hypothetical protein